MPLARNGQVWSFKFGKRPPNVMYQTVWQATQEFIWLAAILMDMDRDTYICGMSISEFQMRYPVSIMKSCGNNDRNGTRGSS